MFLEMMKISRRRKPFMWIQHAENKIFLPLFLWLLSIVSLFPSFFLSVVRSFRWFFLSFVNFRCSFFLFFLFIVCNCKVTVLSEMSSLAIWKSRCLSVQFDPIRSEYNKQTNKQNGAAKNPFNASSSWERSGNRITVSFQTNEHNDVNDMTTLMT